MHADDRDHAAPGAPDVARPCRRTDGLVVEEVGDETVVFDCDRDVAHCLSRDAGLVWRACDGARDLAGLAQLTGTPGESIADALDELGGKGLLDGPTLAGDAAFSRRFALKRIGAAGIAASSVPLIISATIGAPLAHASGGTDAVCAACMINGAPDSCAAGLVCDEDNFVCIPAGCSFDSSCTPGMSCGGFNPGMCNTGCPTGGPLCC
jgi:hypothetical protein